VARIGKIVGLLKALGRASWRDVLSFRSIAGQNFLLFVGFAALQPESAEFFVLILALVLLFPLSSDPMQKIPGERRVMWPIAEWEWAAIRALSFALSPVVWFAVFLLLRAGWKTGALAIAVGALGQLLARLSRAATRTLPTIRLDWIPAPPGVIGAIMRLHWREMLRTLDPYVALILVVTTELYRATGRPLDPGAPRIIALATTLALSTLTQVLLGIDGYGVERYRLVPIRGWQILLAKDLAFLVLLGLLVMPLDFLSGMVSGLAALAIGHHRSVLNPVRQTPWRFTAGVLIPDGAIQTVLIFAVGNAARDIGLPLIVPICLFWLISLLYYGRWWDRQNLEIANPLVSGITAPRASA